MALWQQCTSYLQNELPEQQFNTWIRPLETRETGGELQLLAPNRFILDWVAEKFLPRINDLLSEISSSPVRVSIDLRGSETESGDLPYVERVVKSGQSFPSAGFSSSTPGRSESGRWL